MRRSKVEVYVDILMMLERGPLKLNHIMYKANVNCQALKSYLEILLKTGAIEKLVAGKTMEVFAITPKGIKFLKNFRELSPIDEENRNNDTFPF